MEGRATLLGHPVHQMLIVFPLGLLATLLIFDASRFAARVAGSDAYRALAHRGGNGTRHRVARRRVVVRHAVSVHEDAGHDAPSSPDASGKRAHSHLAGS